MSQSQIPQFSNAYPSSLYEGDHLDNFGYLPSDGQQLHTPDPSYSQQTFDSVPELDLIQPSQPPHIPDSLQQVGPDRKKLYLLWTQMANDEFVAWWLKTDFGSKKQRNIFESRHQSDCWKHFDQVATIKDGTPKVMCKRCAAILDHPANGHRGTSSLNKHYTSGVNCRKTGARGPNIKQLIRDGVSKPYIILIKVY